jgi:hypothetical protein
MTRIGADIKAGVFPFGFGFSGHPTPPIRSCVRV